MVKSGFALSNPGVYEFFGDMTAKQAEVDRDAQLVATEVLQTAAEDIRDVFMML